MGALHKSMKKVAPEQGDYLSAPEKMGLGGELDRDEVTEVDGSPGVPAGGHGRCRNGGAEAGELVGRGDRGGSDSRRSSGSRHNPRSIGVKGGSIVRLIPCKLYESSERYGTTTQHALDRRGSVYIDQKKSFTITRYNRLGQD
jgi:hypothetical protein